MTPWSEAGKVDRSNQLDLVEPSSRDAYLAQELDEMETRLHYRMSMLETRLEDGFKEVQKELREREDRVSKRFTSLTAVLISLLLTIAGGAVMALINTQTG